jgi:hypothetical protein
MRPTLLGLALLLVGLLAASPARADDSPLIVDVSLRDKETFPVLANQLAENATHDQRGLVRWSLRAKPGTKGTVEARLRSFIQGDFTDVVVSNVKVTASKPLVIYQSPSLRKRMLQLAELTPATAFFSVEVDGKKVFEKTQPLNIRSKNDVLWGPKVGDYRWARFIAAWVTPHDDAVQKLLGAAAPVARQLKNAKGNPGVILAGYNQQGTDNDTVERNVRVVARAIYDTIRDQKLGYVSSIVTFGEKTTANQRVRFPRESLDQKSANCIDFVVLFASAFEGLGLHPVVALIPGHALVGVRLRPGGPVLYIETTLATTAHFDQAASRGTEKAKKALDKKKLRLLDITTLRKDVKPFPLL